MLKYPDAIDVMLWYNSRYILNLYFIYLQNMYGIRTVRHGSFRADSYVHIVCNIVYLQYNMEGKDNY